MATPDYEFLEQLMTEWDRAISEDGNIAEEMTPLRERLKIMHTFATFSVLVRRMQAYNSDRETFLTQARKVHFGHARLPHVAICDTIRPTGEIVRLLHPLQCLLEMKEIPESSEHPNSGRDPLDGPANSPAYTLWVSARWEHANYVQYRYQKQIIDARQFLTSLVRQLQIWRALYERIWQRQSDGHYFRRLMVLITIIVQRFLESIFVPRYYSEFPNRRRPPCTTMPWSIWPALVVLWGVCWMFYPRPDTSTSDDLYLPSATDIYNRLPCALDLDQFQSTDSSNFPLDTWLDPFHGASIDSIALDFGHFECVDFHDQSQLDDVPAATLQAPRISKQTEAREMIVNSSVTSATATGLEEYTDRLFNFAASSTSTIGERFPQTIPLSTPVTPDTSHQNPLSSPLTQLTACAVHMALPAQDPIDRLACNRLECQGQTFGSKSALRLHMNKHERPFKCTIPGCSFTTGFASKGDLERHKRAKHKGAISSSARAQTGDLAYYCPHSDCIRSDSISTNKPFDRKDHLREHLKRIHNRDAPDRMHATTRRRFPPTLDAQSLVSEPGDQNLPAVAITMDGPGSRKRRRAKDDSLSSGIFSSTASEVEHLAEEIEELKRTMNRLREELEASRKNEATLISVIGRLTQQQGS